jgi:hypothetical protein
VQDLPRLQGGAVQQEPFLPCFRDLVTCQFSDSTTYPRTLTKLALNSIQSISLYTVMTALLKLCEDIQWGEVQRVFILILEI